MKHGIRVLSEQTANQIAAGEVVIRPASVIKELLENSIDAGSKRVEVRLAEGGLKSIQVIDDGRGMSESDCKLAFLRHATSKIGSIDDLLKIKTLGFRGEALPSIASVSKTRLISRQAGSNEGRRILWHGGQLVENIAVGCPVGTDILVEDLFFNVPARKKYISKSTTEAYQSVELVQKLAIAYPNISFKFLHNDHLVFATSGLGGLEDVLTEIYGLDYVEKTIPIAYQNQGIQISGVIGKSYFHRSNRERQIFIVNGRIVKNNLIQYTLENAYQGKLPVKRYPIAVLNINVPTTSIDVNVHPTKSEIKFAFNEQVTQTLTQALSEGLHSKQHIPGLFECKENKYILPRPEQKKVSERTNDYLQTEFEIAAIFANEVPRQEKSLIGYTLGDIEVKAPIKEYSLGEEQVEDKLANKIPTVFPVLKAIGQLFDSFIVAEGNDALYIIDQHGAHERIHYEDLLEKYSKRAIISQGMATPVLLKLNVIENELLITNIISLADAGIIVEHFGNNDFLIRAVPEGLDGDEAVELLKNLFYGAGEGDYISRELLIEKTLKLIACKQAIKANMALSIVEQQVLIEKLGTKANPYTCPHGRPIITSLSVKDLRKRFDRN